MGIDKRKRKDGRIVILDIPRNLLVLALPRLDLQAAVVHLVHVAGRLHVAEDVVLDLGNGDVLIWRVLVLLDVADDFGRLGPLAEVDQVRLRQGGNAVLDESQVGQVDACQS